ncbi:MAG: MATE family efflux transporter, partial [Pseudomonadota bacterium]
VWAGAQLAGSHGVLAGQGVGAVVFGILAIIVALKVVKKVGDEKPEGPPPPPLWRAALSAFSSGKGANMS